jgi:hypothetical protein
LAGGRGTPEGSPRLGDDGRTARKSIMCHTAEISGGERCFNFLGALDEHVHAASPPRRDRCRAPRACRDAANGPGTSEPLARSAHAEYILSIYERLLERRVDSVAHESTDPRR